MLHIYVLRSQKIMLFFFIFGTQVIIWWEQVTILSTQDKDLNIIINILNCFKKMLFF